MMSRILRHIPNLITCLNLTAGSMAVIFAIDGYLTWAGILIGIAAIFDFLDGVAARLLKAYSELGKELDSLADMVSFGLAPGAIAFTLLEYSISGNNQLFWNISGDEYRGLILFSALLIPVMSALRLARFNVKQSGETYFTGLPTPSNGLFWASMGMMYEAPEYQEWLKTLYSTTGLILLIIIFSMLLVINLPMFSLKFKNLELKTNWYRYVFLGLAGILFIIFNIYGLAAVILLYIILNAVFYLTGIKF